MRLKSPAQFQYQKAALLIVLLVGCVIRLYGTDIVPGGLNQDEASSGYEAFSLLYYHIDRHGLRNPVHLISWGSGQNIAYSWLCMPFIAVLGLTEFSVRLPMGLVGCASIYVFYLMIREQLGERKALIGCLFFALFPWHIMKSRWGLESNLFPDLLLWGAASLVFYLSRRQYRYLYLSALIFAFSLYSYGTAYAFLPFYLAGVWIYMLLTRQLNWKHFLLSALTVFIIAIPIMLFVLINCTDLEQFQFLGMTIPKLYVSRFSSVAGNPHLLRNLKSLLSILLDQGDGLAHNSLPKYGLCYLCFVPLIPAGLFLSLKERPKYGFLIHWWFVCALCVSLVMEININRVNFLWIPVGYYISYALMWIAGKGKYAACSVVLVCALLFGLFLHAYFVTNRDTINFQFSDSLGEALTYAIEQDYQWIYMDGRVDPYIYALFYTQTDPYSFLETVTYIRQHTAFETIEYFGKYCSTPPMDFADIQENEAYIVDNSLLPPLDPEQYHIQPFRYFSVVSPT